MSRPLRVALVGLGQIGMAAHLPALVRADDVDLIAVADPRPEQRGQAARCVGTSVAVVDGLDAVLRLDAIDAVVLATPPWVTPGLIVEAATAGRWVLAEKPVAITPADAEPLRRLHPAAAARVQVGLSYRHDPAMVRLRSLISDGRLGSPLLARGHIFDERRTTDAGHTRLIVDTLRHGTPVIHEGAHVFDWLSYLLDGPPAVVDAWSMRTDRELPADNLTGARLSWPDGSTGLLEFGWLTGALPPCQLSILGPDGHAVLDCRTFALTIDDGGAEPITWRYPGDRTQRCFDRQVARFVDLAAGRGPADPSLADGIAALDLSHRVATLAQANHPGTQAQPRRHDRSQYAS